MTGAVIVGLYTAFLVIGWLAARWSPIRSLRNAAERQEIGEESWPSV